MNIAEELPGIMRSAWEHGAQNGYRVTIILSELDKDEMIYALNNTRFVKEYFPESKAFIPCSFSFENVRYNLIASESLEKEVIVYE